jgi:hypothetical protein
MLDLIFLHESVKLPISCVKRPQSPQVEQTANGYGGAGIYAKEGVVVTLSDAASVRDNRANQCGGGGIRISHGSTLVLTGSAVVSGNSGDMGGGVFAEQNTTIQIADRVRFERNVADPNGGGAISISGYAPDPSLRA